MAPGTSEDRGEEVPPFPIRTLPLRGTRRGLTLYLMTGWRREDGESVHKSGQWGRHLDAGVLPRRSDPMVGRGQVTVSFVPLLALTLALWAPGARETSRVPFCGSACVLLSALLPGLGRSRSRRAGPTQLGAAARPPPDCGLRHGDFRLRPAGQRRGVSPSLPPLLLFPKLTSLPEPG